MKGSEVVLASCSSIDSALLLLLRFAASLRSMAMTRERWALEGVTLGGS